MPPSPFYWSITDPSTWRRHHLALLHRTLLELVRLQIHGPTCDKLVAGLTEDAGVDLGSIPHLPSQQLIHRHTRVFASDVSQHDIQLTGRAYDGGAVKVREAAHVLLVVLDPQLVSADEVALEFLDGHLRGFEGPPSAGLTDTGDVLFGLDYHTEKAVEYPSETWAILKGSSRVTVFY